LENADEGESNHVLEGIPAHDISKMDDTMEVGATVGYNLGNIGLKLVVGYATGDNDEDGYNLQHKGFNITPSFSVSF